MTMDEWTTVTMGERLATVTTHWGFTAMRSHPHPQDPHHVPHQQRQFPNFRTGRSGNGNASQQKPQCAAAHCGQGPMRSRFRRNARRR